MNRRNFVGSILALAGVSLTGWAAPREPGALFAGCAGQAALLAGPHLTVEVVIQANVAEFEQQLTELATRHKALDPAESLFRRIRSDIEQCLAAPGDELIRLEGCTAAGTNKVLVKIKLGPKPQNHMTALRAMQGDIFGHGDSFRG